LLQQINVGFTSDWWNRYQSLIAARQAEAISERDLTELIKMSEALEIANVERVVKALGELAQIRGCSIEQVMEALDIKLKPASN
jgi:chromosome segregation and condensation protein ScpB